MIPVSQTGIYLEHRLSQTTNYIVKLLDGNRNDKRKITVRVYKWIYLESGGAPVSNKLQNGNYIWKKENS